MSKEGIIRNLDNLGRLVIPKEIRESHGFNTNSPVKINIKENHIEISPYHKGCIFCGSEKDLTEFNEQHICSNCIKKLKEK